MTGSQPYSDPVLTEDLWQILFTQAFLFATKYINRLRWRGTFGGVMPDGDDAESIATKAVTEFLQQHPTQLLPLFVATRQGKSGRGRAGHTSTNPLIHTAATSMHQSELDSPLIQQSTTPFLPP